MQVCNNPWQSYDCEWGVRYLWRWIDWLGRADIILLGLMLVYVVAIFTCFCFGRHSSQRRLGIAKDETALTVRVILKAASIKSIASAAPYFGLAGTCLGILNVFRAVDMEGHAAQVMMTSTTAAALVTTAAGILVAVTATCCYNYLRSRLDSLGTEVFGDRLVQLPQYRVAGRLSLRSRFSELPAFALIAAPCIAIVVVASLPFYAFHPVMGLAVSIASKRCEQGRDHRLVVLHINNEDKVFLNQKQEDWNGLAGSLAKVYSLPTQRTIYLSAEDEVRFQTVADAIDIAKITAPAGTSSPSDITVRLIAAGTPNARCPQSVFADSRPVRRQMAKRRHYSQNPIP
jgi:biopolymer transport protein ExbD